MRAAEAETAQQSSVLLESQITTSHFGNSSCQTTWRNYKPVVLDKTTFL